MDICALLNSTARQEERRKDEHTEEKEGGRPCASKLFPNVVTFTANAKRASEASESASEVLQSLKHSSVQRCVTSTETVGTIRDGEPRTATSTFTQLHSSEVLRSNSVLLYVCRDRRD